ncbi:MAG: molybdopterin dinucleotide binding domain-containing protein [Candidatus Jordarchaeum sp.]|uniref:molybdopterin dinucleotide binding domain-containing protein n=1 Tax=Candidatus Jordarchaeum sp. TaxID=2823881 RepID=UPI00404B2913
MSENNTLKAILITGRSLDQGVAIETNKSGDNYTRACGKLFIDPQDMKKLKILSGDTVLLKTNYGEVIVRAEKSPDAPHEGIIFCPMGPWANQVINPYTDSTGMPSFKGVDATVQRAPGKTVLSALELARKFLK